ILAQIGTGHGAGQHRAAEKTKSPPDGSPARENMTPGLHVKRRTFAWRGGFEQWAGVEALAQLVWTSAKTPTAASPRTRGADDSGSVRHQPRLFGRPLPCTRERVPERTRILFVNSAARPGADTAIHALIMRNLDRAAFEVHAACSPGPSYELL